MLSFFASVIATPFGLDGHAATMAAARRVVRKNPVTRRKARGRNRDAIRPGSDWHDITRVQKRRTAHHTLQSADNASAVPPHALGVLRVSLVRPHPPVTPHN